MLVNEDLSSEMFREKLFQPVEYLPNVNYFTLYNFNDEYDQVVLIKFIPRACARDNHLSAIGEVLAQCLQMQLFLYPPPADRCSVRLSSYYGNSH
jgi:hypothetical protein